MRKMNIGIFAHIDAGKTTLTERLLTIAGAIRLAGSVDGGTSATDFLPVERRRGISVRDASVSFAYMDTSFSLIDTPGHADFVEETELALGAVDVCVLVVSAADGVQAQTELLLETMQRRGLPVVIFLNKCDREEVDTEKTLQTLRRITKKELLSFNTRSGEAPTDFTENAVAAIGDESLLESYFDGTMSEDELSKSLRRMLSEGEIYPLLYGSAKTGSGCNALLELLAAHYHFDRNEEAPLSAFVYQVTHSKSLGKTAHIRVFQGKLNVREEVINRRTESAFKATQIKRIQGGKYTDEAVLAAGDVGAVVGLADVRAGDYLGEECGFAPLSLTRPYLRVKVTPKRAEQLNELKSALEKLTDESPSLALEWTSEKRELVVSTSGNVRTEVLAEMLLERFGLEVETGAPSVVYRETPVRSGYGFECYTMPKPCWAVVRFLIEPLPTGSGLQYESICSEKKISYRYQHHVQTAVPRALKEGLMGWEVTDLKVTLVDGEDHPVHTHPLDFFVATPMGIMDGLRNCSTRLLEPVLNVRITAPEEHLGKIIGELTPRRAEFTAPAIENGGFTLEAEIPAAEAMDLQERALMLTGGHAVYDARLKGYYPCPEGKGEVRERTSLNPLDRAKWILHARGAL